MATDEDLNPVSEVVNADWQFDVVRTYVLGVEILDTRLSDAEFRVLSLLRLRASGGRNNFVSYEILAKDLNVSESTIKRTMNGLKKKGYVTCASRGFATSTKKTITSMVERYAPDILSMSRKQILGSERSDELLRRLHCVDKAAQDPLVSNLTPHEIIEENAPHTGQICTPIGSKNDTSEVSNLSPKVNQVNVNQIEVDATRSARGDSPTAHPRSGSQKIQEDPKNQNLDLTTVVLPTQNKSGEEISGDDDRQERAEQVLRGSWDKAVDRTRAQQQKRAERREQRELDGTAEKIREYKAMTKQERMTVGARFREWMKREFDMFFPDIVMGEWTPMEYGQLKTLLGIYSDNDELVKRAWTYVCERWEEVAGMLKIKDAYPTIGFLLGFRNRIFPLVQEQKKVKVKLSDKPGEW